MAIKGKGRTKSRQVARAPKREPVPVPVPFFRRRWVQVLLSFVAGVGVMMLFVWVTNGLRENDRTEQERQQTEQQMQALQQWQTELEGEISRVGQVQNPQPPLVGERLAVVLGEMVREEEPSVKVEQLEKDVELLDKAVKALNRFDLSGLIRDKGFTQVESILASRSETVKALEAYRQATLLAIEALEAEGDQRVALATSAKGVADVGTGLLQDAWRQYVIALTDVGVSVGVPGIDTGFPTQP